MTIITIFIFITIITTTNITIINRFKIRRFD